MHGHVSLHGDGDSHKDAGGHHDHLTRVQQPGEQQRLELPRHLKREELRDVMTNRAVAKCPFYPEALAHALQDGAK